MPSTREETVTKALEEGILAGDVPVGEFLSQRRLAAQFETSLITLRAALRRLENNGLIESVPRWGVRIPVDSPEQVRDRYFMRETLEVAGLSRGLRLLDDAEWDRLLSMAKRCDTCAGDGEGAIRAFAESHHALHRRLVETADSPLLLEHYDRLMARNLMLINARRGWATGRDKTGRHHQTLIGQLRDLSPSKAAKALAEHIRRGLEHELAMMGAD